jgi:WD40 repeat protein
MSEWKLEAAVLLLAVVAISVPWSSQAGETAIAPSAFPAAVLPRPILYIGTQDKRMVIMAIQSDGRSLGIVAEGRLFGWSRQGDRFAYGSPSTVSRGIGSINVMRLGERPQAVFTPRQEEHVFPLGWQSIWSPDGRRIGLLVVKAETLSLVIVDSEIGEIVRRLELPKSAYTREDQPANWPPYNVKWSPDGHKIMVAWEEALILNVESGSIDTIAPMRVMAKWSPDSDGIYYSEAFSVPDLFYKRIGGNETVEVLDHSKLGGFGERPPILAHTPLLKLSPSGSHLAFETAAARGQKAESTILTFDTQGAHADRLGAHARELQLEGVIVAMEWSHDETQLAVLTTSENGLMLRILDLGTGSSKVLTGVVTCPT